MLEKLTDEERELITFRYGKNLENPITGKLSKEQTNKFYRSLVPKMRRLLENPNSERNRKTAKKVDSSKETETLVKEDYSKQNQPSIEKLPLPVVPTVAANIEPNTVNYDIAKSDYVKMLELLRTPTFAQMINVLSVKESIILCLRLGYIDGKYFSTDSIAEFLGIEKEEVIETTKKVLLLYRKNINQFIDNAIEMVTKQSKNLLKK